MRASTLSVETELSGFVDQSPIAAYACDPDGLIVCFNDAAVAVWGRSPPLQAPAERYCGALKRYSVDGFELQPEASASARVLETGVDIEGEEGLMQRPDGTRIRVRWYARALRDEDAIRGVICVLVALPTANAADHERLRLAELLLTGKKLERLGSLAGGITLEFNNRLTSIIANAGLAQLATTDVALHRMLTDIGTAARHACTLSQQLLAVSSDRPFQLEWTDVARSLAEIEPLFEVTLARRAQLTLELAAATIECDAVQLRQLALDLVANAADALPDGGGHVAIRVSVHSVAAGTLRSPSDGSLLPAGSYLRLEVQDDGHGMTEEVRAHACDAFFTTRANRRGLGLLAVVNCIIAHRGAMEIASTPGRGTRVSVWIPAGRDSAQVSPKLVAPGVAPPASRVLVIDDDELIRCVATRALQHAHFAVVASPCGREGLAMFQRARGTWAAILLDLTMPDLRGEDVLRWLRELDVNVPVLLTSGMQDTRAHSEFRRMGANGFIAKPFGAIELVEAIRRIAVAPEPQP